MTKRDIPTVPSTGPICVRCGTDVPKDAEICTVCAGREPDRGRPMFDVGKHPTPPVSENPFIQGVRG